MYRKAIGFTLVELMVVITILAILFTVVVLSYGDWRKTTATHEVTNDLEAAASAMRNYQVYNNAFPPSIPNSFTPNPNVTVTYGSGSGTTYCLNGVSTAVSSVKYKVTNTAPTPTAGSC